MRFGVFGTGSWAKETHAAAIAAHPDAELAGVWGRSPAHARSVVEAYGGAVYEDADELIRAVDAVAVALPPDVQAEIAVRAASAGRHLLLEKPLALSTAAADRVVEAVERGGVHALVFHTARFFPTVQAWVDDVRGGDWHGGGVTWLSAVFAPGEPPGSSEWRRRKGALWDVGPHALDMVLATLGPVEGLVAGAGRGDTVHLVLRHASRASSTLTLSLTTPEPAVTNTGWIYGARGISMRPQWPRTPAVAAGNAISALLAGGPGGWAGHPSDVRYGREIVRILETAERLLGH